MARNGSGVYSLPDGYEAVTGETILATQHNTPLEDLQADANAARPITAGGTGATTAAGARTGLGAQASPAYTTKSTGYTAVSTDDGAVINCTADITLALTAAATLGAKWNITVKANGGTVTIDPNGSETVNGASTFIVYNGNAAKIICDGTNFQVALESPVITPFVEYTPTFTGFGTPSSVSVFSRRVGDCLQIRAKFVGGTSTATEARMSLGFNGTDGSLTVDSTKVPSIRVMGTGGYSTTGAAIVFPQATGGDGHITFGLQVASSSALTNMNGNNLLNPGVTMTFFCEVPITGW